MNDLAHRFHTVKKTYPWLASPSPRSAPKPHVLQLVIKRLSESSGPSPATSGDPQRTLLPWLMEYARPRRPRSGGTTQKASIHKFKRALQACRYSGRSKDAAARALLAEQPSPGNDATWKRLRAKFPDEDPAAVEHAVADAITEIRPARARRRHQEQRL